MGFLQNVTSGLTGILNRNQTNSVIGLDIGSAFLKVVQLKKENGVAVLETYGELALGPYAGQNSGSAVDLSDTQLNQAVKALFREANITTPVGSISLPMDATLVSVIEIPKRSEDHLDDIVPQEARKIIPADMNDVSLDWWVVPSDELPEEYRDPAKKSVQNESETMEVLVVAIHNTVLTKYNGIISQAGLENSSLEIEVFSAVRATLSRTMSAFMIFDMGAATTKVSIVERGIIKASHILNTGSQAITQKIADERRVTLSRAEEMKKSIGLLGEDDERVVSDCATEVLGDILDGANKILIDYQTEHHRTVNKVVLIGGGVLLRGFQAHAQEKLATDVIAANAFSKVENPSFLDPVLKNSGPQFATALGVALRKLENK